MVVKQQKLKNSGRVAIINSTNTYLGFFVLVVLIVESALGALALKTQGQIQIIALYGILFVITLLIGVVSFFAYRRPETLLRSLVGHASPEVRQLQDFCRDISGYWWEKIKPDEPSAISFVEIRLDLATNSVKLKGNAYSKLGEISAIWESVACCINCSERKIFYYWKGWFPSSPNEPFEGFGEISFHESKNGIDRGVGFFFNTNLTDMKSTTKKSVEFRRSMEQETLAMHKDNNTVVSEMIRNKLV